jgi:hypothetical protein
VITDILIRPAEGLFDDAAIKARIEAIPHTALDPVQGIEYLIADSDDTLEGALEERREDPKRFPTDVILVSAVPQAVSIGYRAADPEPVRGLVQWLRQQREVRILDEEYNDLTDQCDDSLALLFGPPRQVGG